MQLHTARIFVRDLADASRFYEEVLGLQLRPTGVNKASACSTPDR